MNIQFSLLLFALIALVSLFLPMVHNDSPVDCDNYSDGTGGYYLKCKDEYTSIYKKNIAK